MKTWLTPPHTKDRLHRRVSVHGKELWTCQRWGEEMKTLKMQQKSGHRPEEAPLWKSSHLGPDRTAERQLSSFYIIFFIGRKDKIKDRTKWPGLTFELPGPAAGELLLCSFFVSVSVSWTEMSQNPDKGGKVHGILSGEKDVLKRNTSCLPFTVSPDQCLSLDLCNSNELMWQSLLCHCRNKWFLW